MEVSVIMESIFCDIFLLSVSMLVRLILVDDVPLLMLIVWSLNLVSESDVLPLAVALGVDIEVFASHVDDVATSEVV